jgi:hypothetical protein
MEEKEPGKRAAGAEFSASEQAPSGRRRAGKAAPPQVTFQPPAAEPGDRARRSPGASTSPEPTQPAGKPSETSASTSPEPAQPAGKPSETSAEPARGEGSSAGRPRRAKKTTDVGTRTAPARESAPQPPSAGRRKSTPRKATQPPTPAAPNATTGQPASTAPPAQRRSKATTPPKPQPVGQEAPTQATTPGPPAQAEAATPTKNAAVPAKNAAVPAKKAAPAKATKATPARAKATKTAPASSDTLEPPAASERSPGVPAQPKATEQVETPTAAPPVQNPTAAPPVQNPTAAPPVQNPTAAAPVENPTAAPPVESPTVTPQPETALAQRDDNIVVPAAEASKAPAAVAEKRTEPWSQLVANPGHAPELLALAAAQIIGPRAADWAARMRDRYPHATDEGLARLAERQFIRFGGVGSVFAAAAGSYAPLALLGSNALTYAELILHVAAAYRVDPTDRQRAVDLLVLTHVHATPEDAEAALTAAEQPAYEEETHLTDAVWRLARMASAQAAVWAVVKSVNRVFPGVTFLSAVITSRSGVRTVGTRATRFYSQLSQDAGNRV